VQVARLAHSGQLGAPVPAPGAARVRAPELVAKKTLSEMAAELHLSRHTARSHLRRLFRRLGETTRDGVVAVAHERRLIDGT
jgi:AraC-like DNA-binding protein